jgi:RNA polymerase sigma-70 factor (ECF subfamily)
VATAPANEAKMSGRLAGERFREVVLPHLPDALSLARWLTGNVHDAEDVVQEACLKAHAGIGTYAGGNARAWLLTIVRHAAYTWLAKNRPSNLVAVGGLSDLDEFALEPDAANTPEAALLEKADTDALQAAITALPLIFREVVVLRDVNGLGYREIAQMLDIPIGTVMSRLARGRGTLILELGKGQ